MLTLMMLVPSLGFAQYPEIQHDNGERPLGLCP